MTAWDTTEEDIAAFAAGVRSAAEQLEITVRPDVTAATAVLGRRRIDRAII